MSGDSRERKRMLRLLVEDVTLRREAEITVQVRFNGGATMVFETCLAPERSAPGPAGQPLMAWLSPPGSVL